MIRRQLARRRIAGMLTASMVFTMLSPAMPAYAAFTHKNINFDLGIYHQYEGIGLNSLIADDTSTVKGKYSDPAKYPLDTGANGQSPTSISPNNLEMPWWDGEWNDANKGAGHTPWGDESVAFNFNGYLLDGWYERPFNEDPTQQKVNKLPMNFPYAEKTYYANYRADSAKKFKLNEVHKSAAGVNAPITIDLSSEYPVLTTVQARPKVVPGYKAEPVVFQFYAPPNPNNSMGNPITPPPASNNYGFIEENNNFTGQMTNKNLSATYEYAIDPDAKFNIMVTHKLLKLDNDGNMVEDSAELEIKTGYNAEDALQSTGDKAVVPKKGYIEAQEGENSSRYLLVEADESNALVKAPQVTSGTVADSSRFISALRPNADGKYFDAANGYSLQGSMPNQSVSVTYTYVPNPNYKLAVTVKYVDESGNVITDKVREVLPPDITNGQDETSDVIVIPVGVNSQNQIFAPDLSSHGFATDVSANITSGSLDSALSQFDPVTRSYTLGIKDKPASVVVTYHRNAAQWGQVLISKDGNGRLMDRNNPAQEYSNTQADAIQLRKDASGNISLDPAILPIPEPGVGYKFDGWYYGGIKMDSANPTTLTGGNYSVAAKFVKDSTAWLTYTFNFSGNNGEMTPSSLTSEVLALDSSTGLSRTILWDDLVNLPEFIGVVPTVTPATGFVVKWYNSNGIEITSDTDMSVFHNETFTAYCVPAGGVTLTTPTVSGSINETNGKPQILVESEINPDPTVQYAVTDADGNIISFITARDLQINNGIISDGLSANMNYQVYEVDSSVHLAIGNNINDITHISAPADVTIPACVAPDVTVDPSDRTKAQITIRPADPNYEYALTDKDGNIVHNWKSPTGDSVTFDGLTPDELYHVVARPKGSNETVADKLPGSSVNTNIGTSNDGSYPLQIITPEPLTNEADLPVDLTSIMPGESITLQAAPLNGMNTFKEWRVILGNPTGYTAVGTICNFKMPSGAVVVEAVYENPAISWDSDSPLYSNNVNDGKNVNVQTPDITELGDYRIVIRKNAVSADAKNAIAQTGTSDFTGFWELTVQIQKKTGAVWTDYNGSVSDLQTFIETGRLVPNREYELYEIATSSNASPSNATKMSGDFENQWASESYPGYFYLGLENGVKYVFGYSELPSYKVEIRDAITNRLLTTLSVLEDEVVNDYESSYSRFIASCMPNPNPDRQGLTWSYSGLSTDWGSYVPYDGNSRLTEDMELYLFYENDSDERKLAESALNDVLGKANNKLNNQTMTSEQQTALKNAINNAAAVMNQTQPRKATTDELRAAADLLQSVLDSIGNGGNNGNNGNNGGGSSSGSSSSGRRNTGTSDSYRVGIDGNWKLLDANNHKWAFVLNSGDRVSGRWARLSYTANGVTNSYWYYFTSDGIMVDGWFRDGNGQWYFLDTKHDGWFGRMLVGWHYDEQDHRWYYLDSNGVMATGWRTINGQSYYFNENAPRETWIFNQGTGKWEFTKTTDRPFGSMYAGEKTPDGYTVDQNGAWVK